jgi:hypothetical protein
MAEWISKSLISSLSDPVSQEFQSIHSQGSKCPQMVLLDWYDIPPAEKEKGQLSKRMDSIFPKQEIPKTLTEV